MTEGYKEWSNRLSQNIKSIYLNDFYNLQGAKLAPYSGYSMPINFSKGIIKEHLHTRSSVGIFDVSHMGSMLIPCTDSNIDKLELVIPMNLRKLETYNSTYTFILNYKGGIVDDLIISKVNIKDYHYFFLVYNASRKEIDQKIILSLVSDVEILLNSTILAIQGPSSQNIINNLFPESKDMKFMQIITINYNIV